MTAVTIDSYGDFEFWHDDRGLFDGHSIRVSGNPSDGPQHADVVG